MKSTDILDIKNTHNFSFPNIETRICWPQRPCNRELECYWCWKRKVRFFIKQFVFFGQHWGFESFVTISLTGFKGTHSEGILLAAEVRKRLHAHLVKNRKYVSIISVTRESPLPHYHLAVTGTVAEEKLKRIDRALKKILPAKIKLKKHVAHITPSTRSLLTLARYLMIQNVQVSMIHRPRGLRIMSASQGFKTGRPQKIEIIEWWHKEACYG